MRCKQCGNEFEGGICPACGTNWQKAESITSPCSQETEAPLQQPAQRRSPVQGEKPPKKKKPFYRRGWVVVVVIVVVLAVGINVFGGSENRENIEWGEMILGDVIPEPLENKGIVYENSGEVLRLTVDGVSEDQYKDYLSACISKGFTVDAEDSLSSYGAYNSEGYRLEVSCIGDSLTITLTAPMEFDTISWPASPAGDLLPVPESTVGQFSFEREDGFFVYVGNMSRAEFDSYVSACADRGFTVDYNKGDAYYYAENAAGWRIALRYEGNDVMSVRIDAPVEENCDAETGTDIPSETEVPEKPANPSNGLGADFKAAMDSYEAFVDEYVAFMEKYAASDGSDLSILSDYADYVSKYAAFCEDFARWEEEELSKEEMAYYLEVQGRTTEKLLMVAQTQ